MKSAYNENWLKNLSIIKEAKRWRDEDLISKEQLTSIREAYVSSFYHPNVMIRILLFVATLIALAGVSGLLALMFLDGGAENVIAALCLIYGLGSFLFLDVVFIGKNNHYKSGVTEALLYHCIGFTIGGFAGLYEFENILLTIVICFLVFSFSAFRYIDLISTICAVLSFAGIVFYIPYEAGETIRQVIPVVFIIVFTPLYFLVKGIKKKPSTDVWTGPLILVESLCLLFIYAAGNYLVVRELSVALMNLSLEDGQDIPLAFLFYALTIIIPITYLYFGIKNKDIILLRVSLVVLAFSVFTFKFYYSTGHPEITLTLAGVVLLTVSLYLFRYLKVPKNGFTRETILKEKWANMNVEAFIISQTLGGNAVTTTENTGGGGGGFSGGGSTDQF
jgi:hypothetical protein